ncbi:MAG: hypothetical protein SVU32_01865 [Candidatus Nanohaloarchaea archaeon]|nr:hypothetical protein [Candidatus Nanohaloarchaea archaeon]
MDQELEEMFRAYDIRGNTESVLTPDVMRRIGKAYGSLLDWLNKEEVVVGHDARNTSDGLSEAFIGGVEDTGRYVVDLRREPFGVVLFYAWRNDIESAYITASHLPKQWNGVKFYHPNGVGYTAEENEEVRDLFMNESFVEGDGTVEEMDVREEYLDFVRSQVDGGDASVLLDCGNGVAGLTAPELFRKAGFDVTTLFEEPDGSFPNRESDITDESVSRLREEVADHDFGIAYDGDSDRCALVTREGRLLEADETAAIVLEEFLREREGTIIANVECSRMIEDVAERHGCTVERVRVGHTYLYKAVHDHDAIFGVEKAGHFAVPHVFPLDDAVAASLFFASQVDAMDRTLEEVVEDLPDYHSDRIAFECPDDRKFDVVNTLTEEFRKEYDQTTTIDGIRVDLEEGWVLIRASNTSPKIRLTLEAEDREAFERLRERFSSRLERAIEDA